jgi:PAS domain S-box-containing protein
MKGGRNSVNAKFLHEPFNQLGASLLIKTTKNSLLFGTRRFLLFSVLFLFFSATSSFSCNISDFRSLSFTNSENGYCLAENSRIFTNCAVEISNNTNSIFISKIRTEPLNINFSTRESKTLFVLVSFVLFCLTILFLYQYLKLRKANRKLINLQQLISKSSDEYERIFDALQDVYYRADENGIINLVSPSITSLSGYKPEDVIGKHDSFFYFNPQNRDVVMRELLKKGSITDEKIILKNSDGAPLTFSINAKIIRNQYDKVVGFEGVLRDISHSIASEEKLKRSEQKLIVAAEIAQLGVSEYSTETRAAEINSTLSTLIFGESSKSFISIDTIFNLIHPEDSGRLKAKYDQLLEGRIEEFEMEFRVAGPDGNFRWFKNKYIAKKSLISGNKPEILGIHLLIDEFKTTMLKYQHNQRLLEVIYNTIPIMLIVVDSNMIITEVNDVISAFTSLSREHVTGKNIREIIQFEELKEENTKLNINEMHSPLCDLVENSITNQENIYNREISFLFKGQNSSDKRKYFSVSTSIFIHNTEKRVLLSIFDITERKIADIEVEKSKIILEENHKLKSDFIANLSFELRSPINSIMGFVSLLKNKSVSLEQKEKYIEVIKESSDRLLGIIENVIELSKVEFEELDVRNSEFSIVTLIKTIAEKYRHRIMSKNLELIEDIEIASEQALYNSDLQKIKSILSHIIENAIKYTVEGSITLGAKLDSTWLKIYVKDTGVGIGNLEKIFYNDNTGMDDLLNFNNQDGGMGISLRICNAYAQVLGGSIAVDSAPGKGSKFELLLPIASSLPKEIALPEKKEILGKFKILIVEDEDYNYNYLSQVLELEGYDFAIADDGQKAVDFVKSEPNIDLILMDIRLPVLDGLEASKIIKGINPKIPIIAQTAYGLDSEEDRLMEEYCDDYIQKPIVSKILITKIKKFLI